MAGIGVLLRGFAALLGLCLLLWGAAANPYLPAREAAPLLAAIAREKPDFVVPQGVTGIIVPHHLLAVDLIARGYWAASAGHYSRVIVLSPDHFHRVGMAFGTTKHDLATVFGAVNPDAAGVAALLMHPELVEALPDVDHEHGIMVEAPFIKFFFPTAEVIPILASVNAGPAEWRAMTELLKPLVTPTTLVVQSTDFSHYRPLAEAVARDQESLAAIATGDPEEMVPLLQPSHLDSKAAGYIELALQRELLGAHPVILANGNSVEYGGDAGSTTSYVVAAFVRDDADGTAFGYKDQSRTMFAGDVLLGRYFLPALRDQAAWSKIRDMVLGLTRLLPLVVNLEGVLLDGPVTGVGADAHVMVPEDAAPMLAALHTMAASLANNHANDLGPEVRAESVTQLKALGIAPLEHGTISDFGAFRLLALNFVGGRMVGDAIADPENLDWVCGLDAAPPLVAFVHWGTEYTTAASVKEHDIAAALARCGVSLIVGAHSHQASTRIESISGGGSQMVYSLGNFLFDQSSPRGSGALLELRVFRQGTVAARLVPVPNLFDLSRE